jgi:hypothetical protein
MQVTYFALQMMTGPSELEAIAGVNTTNDALRRALIGQDTLRLTTRHRSNYLNKAQHQQILLQNAHTSIVLRTLQSCSSFVMQVQEVSWMLS